MFLILLTEPHATQKLAISDKQWTPFSILNKGVGYFDPSLLDLNYSVA